VHAAGGQVATDQVGVEPLESGRGDHAAGDDQLAQAGRVRLDDVEHAVGEDLRGRLGPSGTLDPLEHVATDDRRHGADHDPQHVLLVRSAVRVVARRLRDDTEGLTCQRAGEALLVDGREVRAQQFLIHSGPRCSTNRDAVARGRRDRRTRRKRQFSLAKRTLSQPCGRKRQGRSGCAWRQH